MSQRAAELIESLACEELDEREVLELRELIVTDPEVRRLYVERMFFEADLIEFADSQSSVATRPVRRFRGVRLLAGVAAVALLAGVVGYLVVGDRLTPVAAPSADAGKSAIRNSAIERRRAMRARRAK